MTCLPISGVIYFVCASHSDPSSSGETGGIHRQLHDEGNGEEGINRGEPAACKNNVLQEPAYQYLVQTSHSEIMQFCI